MPAVSDPLLEASLGLAWSQWSALGIRATAHPSSTAVDPEALLYFTACVVDRDPRLRDEVADWWRRYERLVSRTRLSAVGKTFGAGIVSRFEQLRSAISRMTRSSGKSRLDHLNTPARSMLRMRAVFGTNARAEVLLELLTRRAQRDDGLTALALSAVGYSKRNVAYVLDELVMGGLVEAIEEGNRVRFRLIDAEALERVLRPMPSEPGHWHFRLPVLAAFVELADRIRERDAVVQGIEARKLLERMRPTLARAGTTGSASPAIAETYWPALQRWLIDHVIADATDSNRRIAGMIEGVWVGPKHEVHRPERFSSAVLPRLTADTTEDRELECLDLVQVPTVEPANEWIWAVLSTAATQTYAHTIGLDRAEPWRFVTWAFGEPRTYAVQYGEPVAQAKIARLYGRDAAARARTDRPAVQLRLKRNDRHPSR